MLKLSVIGLSFTGHRIAVRRGVMRFKKHEDEIRVLWSYMYMNSNFVKARQTTTTKRAKNGQRTVLTLDARPYECEPKCRCAARTQHET